MQFAGQICGQRPQATHFERPCASVSIRCVPRQRVARRQSSVLFCSGYCMVKRGWNMCLNVSTIPLSVARR